MESLFRNTLSPMQWALMAAIPPAILALYFLKLRRSPVKVPSTYLWMRAIEDLHVNSLWQRLRKSLLLLLQLLLVALAMLALLRPGWQGTRQDAQRLIFLVDNSASMSATDADGRSRLEASKEKIAQVIKKMQRGMSGMIISYSDKPRVVQEPTDNRRLLLERLETIQPTSASTDVAGALRLAEGLANSWKVVVSEGEQETEVEVDMPTPTTLYMFTDGRFEAVEGVELGVLDPVFVAVGSRDSNNLAITAFNTRRNEARPGEKEAFVQVSNFTDKARKIVVDLRLNGEWLDAVSAEAPAGGVASYTFPLADAPAGRLEARIDKETLAAANDALETDNNAYAVINDAAPGAILLVTPGNLVVETALGTLRAGRLSGIETVRPTALEDKEQQRKLLAGDYDLVIFDRCGPKSTDQMPRASTLFIGQKPPLAGWGGVNEKGESVEPPRVARPQVIDWNRSHPLMGYVQVGDPLIVQSMVLTPPPGATSLIDSTEGPLLALAPRDSFEDLVLGFAILDTEEGKTVANTDWYRSRGFPTFWLNVLDYFTGSVGDPARGQTAPGEPIEIRPKTTIQEIVVKGPEGLERALKRKDEAPFVFQETDQRGVYEVEAQQQVVERFAVNLFDGAESAIRLLPTAQGEFEGETLESIRIGFTDVVADSTQSPARQELWRMLLLLAIVVLLFEWYIYNRRVFL